MQPGNASTAAGTPQALCPSAICTPGAILLGVVQADGSVAYLDHRRVVDEFFVKLAREGRSPERRFRFADRCVKSACQQWANGRCGVVDRVLAANSNFGDGQDLPPCTIRGDCRWHMQWGRKACNVCPLIVTDLTQPATDDSS